MFRVGRAILSRMFLLRAFILASIPTYAAAHTRWFAVEEIAPYETSESLVLYLALWALIAALIVACGIYFERRAVLQLSFLRPKAAHAFDRAAAAFSMVAGAFFLIAGTHEYLFSPNLTHESGIPMFLIYLQALVGLAFLSGVFARVASLLLIALWFGAITFVGALPLIEDVWVLSTAAFVFIMGTDYFSLVSFRALSHLATRYRSYALPLLRIGTGATFLILGFSEKILHPEYGINFLQQYDWNFMSMMGMGYSDYLFTISAGAVESLLGFVFLLGIVTRLNALVVAVFFSIPIILLGPIELAGHLPHLAAVVLLLMYGSGQHLKITRRS